MSQSEIILRLCATRYSIMLQIVVMTTLILVGSGAFFAWLQNRPQLEQFERS